MNMRTHCGAALLAALLCTGPALLHGATSQERKADQLQWRLTRYCKMVQRDGKQFLQILIRHLNENMDCYRKIYEANKDGELMGILRNGLLLIFTKKLEDAEKDGIKAKIAYPILSCLLTDFFFSVIKCYLELSGQFDTDVFIENICRFAERDFFTE